MTQPNENSERPEHLFKPGVSGNPSGRPRSKVQTLAEDVAEVFGESVAVNVGGKVVRVQTVEQVFMVLCSGAIKGDSRLLRHAIELMLTLQPMPGKPSKAEQARREKETRERLSKAFKVDIGSLPNTPEVRKARREFDKKARQELARRRRERESAKRNPSTD